MQMMYYRLLKIFKECKLCLKADFLFHYLHGCSYAFDSMNLILKWTTNFVFMVGLTLNYGKLTIEEIFLKMVPLPSFIEQMQMSIFGSNSYS